MRPIKKTDLDGLLTLLQYSGYGLTSLPRDPEVLMHKIEASEESFKKKLRHKPGGELYLFVMEDLFSGEICGISGIISKIGGYEPDYFYELKEKKQHSDQLQKDHIIKTLHLHKTHSGPAEICSIFLSPLYRQKRNSRLLSLSRFLYIAEHIHSFEKDIIAEMRGVVDDNGRNPFYEVVGKKFLQISFIEADFLRLKNRSFIEDLLPHDPIIVDLLPEEAQAVVAEVHPETVPARKILEKEGFTFCGLVGIFEPGPVLKARVENLRSIKDSVVVSISDISTQLIAEHNQKNEKNEDVEFYIISNRQNANFKSCVGQVILDDKGGATIPDVVATALRVKRGDQIRIVTFK